MESPFKFLDYYTKEDEDIFFGREKEKEILYDLVKHHRLSLVYGPSGVGKTSLVRCGLANKFDSTEWLPIILKRKSNINQSLLDDLKCRLIEDKEMFANETDPMVILDELSAQFMRPVYLIFDQFEELFIEGKDEEVVEFVQTVKRFVHAGISARIVIVIREDYLGPLYVLEQQVAIHYEQRMRVNPMNWSTVRDEVLARTFSLYGVSLEPHDVLEEIGKNLGVDKGIVHLPFLQIYLDQLWRRYIATDVEDKLDVTAEEVESLGEINGVVSDYVEQTKENVLKKLSEDFPGNNYTADVNLILEGLVSEEGTKRTQNIERDSTNGSIKFIDKNPNWKNLDDEVILKAVAEFRNHRLLRIEEKYIELSHDSLAKIIVNSRSPEEVEIARLKKELSSVSSLGTFFNNQQLLKYQVLKEKGRLNGEEKEFIDKNRKHNKGQKIKNWLLIASPILIFLGAVIFSIYWNLEKERAKNLGELNDQLSIKSDSISKAYEKLTVLQERTFSDLERTKAIRNAQNSAVLIEADINRLKFSSAFDSLAVSLIEIGDTILHPKLVRVAKEVIFISIHSGDYAKAEEIIDQLPVKYDNNNFQTASISSVAWEEKEWSEYLDRILSLDINLKETLTRKYFPEMTSIDGGTYDMGLDSVLADKIQAHYLSSPVPLSGSSTYDYSNQLLEKPLHSVNLSAFDIGKTEITLFQYALFCLSNGGESNLKKYLKVAIPDESAIDGWLPACRVSWNEATAYCNWLSDFSQVEKFYKFTGAKVVGDETLTSGKKSFRLPTEAEWEYAAKDTIPAQLFSGGDDLNKYAVIGDPGLLYPVRVKSRDPNRYGLYDMNGNVWEWCHDFEVVPSTSFEKNPGDSRDYVNKEQKPRHILRGGARFSNKYRSNIMMRIARLPGDREGLRGFRVAKYR